MQPAFVVGKGDQRSGVHGRGVQGGKLRRIVPSQSGLCVCWEDEDQDRTKSLGAGTSLYAGGMSA